METKRAKVIMLPTKDKTDIVNNTYCFTKAHGNPLRYVPKSNLGDALTKRGFEYQHLYITIDEKIKEGDWCLDNTYRFQVNKDFIEDNPNLNDYCKKIIATTNITLGLSVEGNSIIDKMRDYSDLINTGTHKNKLPQIPSSFIEEYVNQGGIDEVEVEYDDRNHTVECGTKYRGCSPDCTFHNNKKLKVDSNNTITILPIKEKMYSREEVENLCRLAFGAGVKLGKSTIIGLQELESNWIKENLK